MKKILITGATGAIGQNLVRRLLTAGNQVFIFTQNPEKAAKKLPEVKRIIKWDYDLKNEWKHELNGIDAVVHLAGENLSVKRWSEKFKKSAYESRILSTRKLVEAIKSIEQKPNVFICASGVGIYGNRYDEILDEKSLTGNDFLSKLCTDWETEAKKVEELGVRRVSIRTGLVLIKDDGVLKKLKRPFKLFIGGSLGNGRQWFPWIHIDDVVGIYLKAIEDKNLCDVFNAASPGIVRTKEFAKTFGKILNRPSFLNIPKFAMKIAAGEVADYAVMSQRISADKILNSGYKFKFENLEEALRDLLK
ncbi:MAG: TIGR01777 family oxidoreductase [Ignavibacteriales bacterium]